MTDDKENHIQQALDEILILERAAASNPNNVGTRRQSDIKEVIETISKKMLEENDTAED